MDIYILLVAGKLYLLYIFYTRCWTLVPIFIIDLYKMECQTKDFWTCIFQIVINCHLSQNELLLMAM